ncbi:MAG: hypothetical protein JJ979_03275 [Roseibium sp.]|nr:hypothetical protein [Roseibium sp.]
MTNEIKDLKTLAAPSMGIARLMSGFGPQIHLAPDDETGTPPQDDPKKKEADESAENSDDNSGDDDGSDDNQDNSSAKENGSEDEKSKVSDDMAKLLRENMKRKGQVKELTEKLALFKDIDPEEFKTLKSAKLAAEQAELEAKGEFETVKNMMATQHEEAVTALNEQINGLKASLAEANSTISELTVGNDFNTSTFINEELVLTPTKARVIWGGHFAQEDGKTVAYDKPASAKERTVLVDAKGVPLSFDDAMRHLVKNDPEGEKILRSKIKPGAGSKTVTDTTTATKSNDDELKGVERIRAGLAKLDLKSS